MTKKKAALIVLCAVASVIIAGILVFLILSDPERVLRRKIGIIPSDHVVLSNKARDLDTIGIWYSYELEFDSDDYNEVFEKLHVFSGCDQTVESGTQYEGSIIQQYVDSSKGFPLWKHWFDPNEESPIWVYDDFFLKMLITSDTAGTNHAYIQWSWSPLRIH